MKRIHDGRDLGAFIPSDLDDFGLDPYAFRVYSRIVRRAGTKQGCFESIDNIAKACRIDRNRVYKALKLLIKHRLIEKEPCPGKPSSYFLTPASEWIPLPDLSDNPDTQPIRESRHHLSGNPDTTYLEKQIPPICKSRHKGSKEGNPKKEQQEGGEIAVVAADPFFNGQVRAIARELKKQAPGPRNFVTDAPWGELASELGKDPLSVWKQFEQYLIAVHSDKKQPEKYASTIATSLYQNPGTELACVEWKNFEASYRKNLSAPPPPQKKQPRHVVIEEIPDREESAKAIRAAREARQKSREATNGQ